MLVIALLGLVLSYGIGTLCEGICDILEVICRAVAFMLMPVYMLIALSARAKQRLDEMRGRSGRLNRTA